MGYLLRGHIGTGLGLMVLWWLVLGVSFFVAVVTLGASVGCLGPAWFVVPIISALAVVEEPVWSVAAWGDVLNLPRIGWLSPADLTPHQVGQARSCAYHYGRPAKPPLYLRHLERWPPGTTYPHIAEQVGSRLQAGPLGHHACRLVLDGTAVGPASVDLFRGVGITPLVATITGGDSDQVDGALHRVPRRDLVSAIQAVLQTERLKIAAALPEAKTLTEELLTFQMRQTPDTAVEVPWREGPRDDLVLATALAVWWREWWSAWLDADHLKRTV